MRTRRDGKFDCSGMTGYGCSLFACFFVCNACKLSLLEASVDHFARRLVIFAKRYDAEQALTNATVLNGKNLKLSWHTEAQQSSQGSSSNGASQGEAVDDSVQIRIGGSADKRTVVARK